MQEQRDKEPEDASAGLAAVVASPPRVARLRWRKRFGRACFSALTLVLVLVTLLATTGWLLSGGPRALPVWIVAEVQNRLNHALKGHAVISIDGVEVEFGAGRLPELRLNDLAISPAEGGGFLRLPEVTARFDGAALLWGQVKPVAVNVTGAQIALRRELDGRFALEIGQGPGKAPGSLAELLQEVDAFFALPALATLQRVETGAMTLTLDDRRADRVWTMGDGRMTLIRQEGETVLDLGVGLIGGGAAPATAQMSFRIRPGGEGARLAVRVDHVAAADLAVQTPILAWLGVMEAPISGDLRGAFDGAGQVQQFEGSLSIGKGALRPVPGIRPVPLNHAELQFGFDPEAARITVSELRVESDALRVSATAHTDLIGLEKGIPDAFVTQVRFTDVQVDPEGVFTEPVRFSEGALDLRLRLDPFSVDVGQLSLREDDRHLTARGGVQAGAEGWTVALDLELDRIRHDRLLALWPVELVPRTREWLVNNVQEGLLFDVKGGLRLRPGQEPRLSLGYEFADADVRFLKTLPPIRSGRGYAVIENQSYVTTVEDGYVEPPEGGRIAVSRSVFRVPDITVKPPPAEITLQTESSVTAALSLLDLPPFGFMTKAGLGVDLGEGRATLSTVLRLPLAAKLLIQDVDFSVTGNLSDLRSERLVPGRVLTAARLNLAADPQAVTISGRGMLGQVGFDARWSQPLGPGTAPATVAGNLQLDAGFAAEFLTALPAGSLSGDGRAQFEIALPKGEAPHLKLSSDLRGVAVRIADLGWSKSANAGGRLVAEGRLGTPMQLDRLVLEGPGLAAEGRLMLAANGALDRLDLTRVRLGDWLDASGVIAGQGKGRPVAVSLTGGSVDLRHLPEGGGAAGRGGAGQAVQVALDRVVVSEGIALTAVRGRLSPKQGGLDGAFTGQLNGQAPLSVQLVPGGRGTAFRIRAEDGGAALAAAKLFGKARGGALDVTLVPAAARGHYDGTFAMTGFNVHNMPALAKILNAVSIVGLIDELASSGLVFSEAQGNFRLTPDAVELREAHAVGASFGVSLEGVYLSRADVLDLQGVISPFYLINGIGSVMTRPGEGVLGFTYRVEGSAKDPQVSVNPLSVLAPGFLRELLRRPAARLAP